MKRTNPTLCAPTRTAPDLLAARTVWGVQRKNMEGVVVRTLYPTLLPSISDNHSWVLLPCQRRAETWKKDIIVNFSKANSCSNLLIAHMYPPNSPHTHVTARPYPSQQPLPASPSGSAYDLVLAHPVLPGGVDLPDAVVPIVVVPFGQNLQFTCGAAGQETVTVLGMECASTERSNC